jgi:ketosteroid isomerase-like protein
MNWFNRSVVAVSFIGIACLAMPQGAAAQQADIDAVKAAAAGFFAAISSRDVNKVEPLWAKDAGILLINPPDKTPSIGWDAVKKNWEARFDAFSEWKVTPKEGPHVQVNQGTATATAVASVEGKNKAGAPQSFTALVTQVYVKRGDRWLMIANHASRAPD